LIFNHNDNEATITLSGDASWIKINTNQVGYYRVNYAAEQWGAITSALKASRETFTTADRAHLLNDADSLAAAGQLSYSVTSTALPPLRITSPPLKRRKDWTLK